MKKPKPFEAIRQAIEFADKQWQKEIDDEPNAMVKKIKQDYKDLKDLEAKLDYFRIIYGIDVRLHLPKKFKGEWLV